jgi:protein FAM32A
MTEAEKKFEEIRKKRLQDRIRKEARTTHKEKVEAFNKYLESLSEHHDIPKVGPG